MAAGDLRCCPSRPAGAGGSFRPHRCRFTGPIYPEETGRGYFTGIGVAPQYGRHGLGTLLFYRLLEQEQAAGAKYMSLFTGQTNPAKQIYSGAGFREVRTFGVMLKEL